MLIKTDELGIPRFTNKDLVDMIYSGHVDKCHVVLCDPSDNVDKFNAAMREQYLPELKQYIPLDVDQKDFDKNGSMKNANIVNIESVEFKVIDHNKQSLVRVSKIA